MATRWGIASTGKISQDFVAVLNILPKDEHKVVAVGARKLESAQDFAKKYDIPKAYGSYEELSDDSDVDVVYVGSVNKTHFSISKMMMEKGKAVLCEKPLCMDVQETKQLIEAAQSAKVFLMEGIWSRCFPVYRRLSEELKSGTIGDIWQVLVSFGVPIHNVDRIKSKELGGGSVLDLGVYCVQLCQLVFGGEKPVSIQASGFLNSDGVDDAVSATLKYSENRIATINTHTRVQLPCEAFVVGTKGIIKIPFPFWCPDVIEINKEPQHYPLPEMNLNHIHSSGFSYEAGEVRKCLKEGLLESPLIPHEQTIVIAEIMESLRKQVGVVYPQDQPDDN